MIDREFAVRAAQEDLDRRYSGQLVVSGTEEHELVWIVYYQSAEYLRTGDLSHMLGGNGPYLVDRVDGGLHQIGPCPTAHPGPRDEFRCAVAGPRSRWPFPATGRASRMVITSPHFKCLHRSGLKGASRTPAVSPEPSSCAYSTHSLAMFSSRSPSALRLPVSHIGRSRPSAAKAVRRRPSSAPTRLRVARTGTFRTPQPRQGTTRPDGGRALPRWRPRDDPQGLRDFSEPPAGHLGGRG